MVRDGHRDKALDEHRPPYKKCNHCTILRMPTIVRLSSCTITMYAADHQPPHFHVRMRNGREALVEIRSLRVLSGSVRPRELDEAIEWAAVNTRVLIARWQELNP